MSNSIEVILFDLGGVLVELGDISSSTAWFKPELSARENWHLWLTAPKSHALERGEISPRKFAVEFIQDNGIDIDPDTFLCLFRDWVIGFYPGAIEYIQTLSKSYRLGVFSNITEIHWPPIEQELIQSGAITDYFASYQIGHAKPDVDAFIYVTEEIGVSPEAILFVDDNLINVEAARVTGMQAKQVIGFAGLQVVLQRYGIV